MFCDAHIQIDFRTLSVYYHHEPEFTDAFSIWFQKKNHYYKFWKNLFKENLSKYPQIDKFTHSTNIYWVANVLYFWCPRNAQTQYGR